MQFQILFKKNFIYWKRHYKTSIAEILVPLLLALLLIALKRLATTTTATEGSAPALPLLTNIDQLDQVPLIALNSTMKNCLKRSGGSIGLAPDFDLTRKLEPLFKKLNYTTIFFKDNAEVDNWVQSDDYLELLPDGSRRQLCLAVVFDKLDKLNYEYQLRYNLTGNPATIDHYETNAKAFRKPFKVEDLEEFARFISNGMITIQGLVDGLIFQKELGARLNIRVQKFKNPQYELADFTASLESPFIITLITAAMIAYLRFISHVVGEREKRNIENMENMGLSKFTYLISVYVFNVIVHFFIALIFAGIIKAAVFKQVNYGIMFLTYFLFIVAFMTIASIISCFFVAAKKGIITGLIVFFFLFMFWILRDSISPSSYSATTALALSPIGNISQLVKNFLVFENSYTPMGFKDLKYEANSFMGQTYFIILAIEIVIFFWLGAYLFYVVPLKIGIAKHPLFIFGYPWKRTGDEDKLPNAVGGFDEDELRELMNTDFPKENFEPVEEELKMQSRNNQALSLVGLTKVFANKKVAVSNLSLEMYKDQIFALLGHNGAGKTTTISMVSGFIDKTKGEIKIFGLDVANDREKIKTLMGICPQVNPIFPYLTVKEHLELYGRIKGVSGNLEPEIDELLGDIDLLHKKNYLAGNLSGGQKRKLCVAIALMGKSKIILLDEPTSGMDTYARRHLWEMLKKYKKDRIIILTTHNMDEADYLGDRIGIMSSGKLVTCGSAMFLKQRFGDGYELVILKNPGADQESSQKIKSLVFGLVSKAVFVSEIGSELKFKLPNEAEHLDELFAQLETYPPELHIQSFGITLATLEDVFIKVAQIEVKNTVDVSKPPSEQKAIDEDSDHSKIYINSKNNLANLEGIEREIENKDLQALRLPSQAKIFNLQVKALIKKRFIFFSRDISGIVCEIFLPILIIIAGLGLSKIAFVVAFPTLELSPSLYPSQNAFLINGLEQGGQNITSQLLGYFPNPPFLPSVLATNNASDFGEMVYTNKSEDQIYAYFLNGVNSAAVSYTMLFNTTAPFAPYMAVNRMNTALLKYLSGNGAASIKMSLNPLLPTKGIKSIEDTIDGFIVVMLLALAFSFIPSSMVLYLIKERENNAKHQQIISGVNIFAYWLSNFVVDYVKYLIPAMATYALFFIFQVGFLIDGERAGVSFLLLFLYGFAMLAFTYVSSFLFRKPSSGQIFLFLWCFATSFVLLIVMFSLKLLESTRDITQNLLDYIFRIIPSFSFPYGFLMMANQNLLTLIFRWPKDTSAFSPKIAMWDLVYIPVTGLLIFGGLFLIEYWFVFASWWKKSRVPTSVINRVNAEERGPEGTIDPDVQAEEENVKNTARNFAVKVKDLWKIYPLSSSSNKQGKNINYKAAVKGITFGVEQGMVFSLLGTNGAGKTSTFKILTGDTSATFGEATIMDFEMPRQLIEIRHLVGYCPQFDSILENLTAYEHLELYANLKGINPQYHRVLIERMLETMNLTKYRDIKAGTYSGGNKRKLNVAIALLGRPPIVFLDEPSSGMDPEARRFMWSVINDISTKRRHSSVILTTHSMEEAEALSTKIAIMVEGRIKTIGSVQQLKNKFGKDFELDIKLKLPLDNALSEFKQQVFQAVNVRNQDQLTGAEVHRVFEHLGLQQLEKEIEPTKKGAAIYKRLELNKAVESNLLFEWIMIAQNLGKVETRLRDRFQATVLETFQSYIRFRISESNKLSEIFGYMNSIKEELSITTYSVRQISLEQIFIQFAQNIQHDD